MIRKINTNGLEIKVHGNYKEVGTVFSVDSTTPTQLAFAPILFDLARPLTIKELTYVKSVANKRNRVYYIGNHVHEGAVYNPETEEVILVRSSPLVSNSNSFIRELVSRERLQDSEKEFSGWNKLKKSALKQEKVEPHKRSCHLVRDITPYTEVRHGITPIEENVPNPELSFLYEEPPERLLDLFKTRNLECVDLELFGYHGDAFNDKREYEENRPLFDKFRYPKPFVRNFWVMGHTENYISISSSYGTEFHALGCFYLGTQLKPEELRDRIKSFGVNKTKEDLPQAPDVDRILWVIPTMFGRTIDIQKISDLPVSIRREFSKFGTHKRVSFYEGKRDPHLQDYYATYYVGDNGNNPLENLIEPDNLTLPTNKPDEVPSTGDILITFPQGLVYLGGSAGCFSRKKPKLDRDELQKVKNTYKHWR